jgi:hypothetical protein
MKIIHGVCLPATCKVSANQNYLSFIEVLVYLEDIRCVMLGNSTVALALFANYQSRQGFITF